MKQRFKDTVFGLQFLPAVTPIGDETVNMEWRDTVLEEEFKYGHNSTKVEYDRSYHYYDDTKYFFPTLHLDSRNVPLGDSQKFCLHLTYANHDPDPKKRKNEKLKFTSVDGMDKCAMAQRLRNSFWDDDHPVTGLNT